MGVGVFLLLVLGFKLLFASDIGILILAHGGSKGWNKTVDRSVAFLKREYPLEIAYGMANPRTISSALKKLEDKGIKKVIAIPIFISSHSPIIDQLEYILGLKDKLDGDPIFMLTREKYYRFKKIIEFIDSLPPALSWWIWEDLPEVRVFRAVIEKYAKDKNNIDDLVKDYEELLKLYDRKVSSIRPLDTKLKIYLAKPFDDHPVIAEILCDRVMELSVDPSKETVIFVAHGPNEESNNVKWIKTMESLAKKCQEMVFKKKRKRFKAFYSITVRDDAPEPIYDQAKEHLRALVRQSGMWGDVIVVPFLVAEGRVSKKIKARLEGLDFRWSGKTILPSPKFENYLRERIKEGLSHFTP